MHQPKFLARDPGVRGGLPAAGGPMSGLSDAEHAFFVAGQDAFQEVQSVQGTIPDTELGLGPRFNLDSCAGCHSHPAIGGSSPFENPQIRVATKNGATNRVPFFITIDGPIREARFKFNSDGTRDGEVHNLYTITGRVDAPGCILSQPDFKTAATHNNLSFRIPTPVFGGGLIEAIQDSTIRENQQADRVLKRSLGIAGRANTNETDGTITRFGWKAQIQSLEIFSGREYNVEQGVTNELFLTEREETQACLFNKTPEDVTKLNATKPTDVSSDVVKFATFIRFLAPPIPVPDIPSIARGRALFNQIGCAFCHTPSLPTGRSSSGALNQKQAHLFSDLLVHRMGTGLADEIIQEKAGADEFRTAPLWGLGQRIFFLHDGRTKDLLDAIRAHASGGDKRFSPSEANKVIDLFSALKESEKQDILNFLRGL
jgi:CxxC motif-containing protein (DUF1111 family)